jgi:hypothetical protein
MLTEVPSLVPVCATAKIGRGKGQTKSATRSRLAGCMSIHDDRVR